MCSTISAYSPGINDISLYKNKSEENCWGRGGKHSLNISLIKS